MSTVHKSHCSRDLIKLVFSMHHYFYNDSYIFTKQVEVLYYVAMKLENLIKIICAKTICLLYIMVMLYFIIHLWHNSKTKLCHIFIQSYTVYFFNLKKKNRIEKYSFYFAVLARLKLQRKMHVRSSKLYYKTFTKIVS